MNPEDRDSGKQGVKNPTSRLIINELELAVNLFFTIAVVFLHQSQPARMQSGPLPHLLPSSFRKKNGRFSD